ncbi:HpcH/HpaI aldolase/citrate lyase family protein [Pseudoflavonifractor sp. MSJ-37]|uniref:HpcH/HpaI aldolase family protein n=1 Tax=Pseudoflavonifractor sp. MSJ-37 TaxID=2841531 RepID=UPI001C1005AC|nr:aldolase/citrate lyase family protein [Pseudoflavonifractor sp. MSJ-37]MBU5434067.1 hypothetical protein [Pseudoflavonifractor sp. MSJ-37]
MDDILSTKRQQGLPAYGTFTQLKSTAAIENIACVPFDFVIIDSEHQEIGTDLMTSAVAAAEGAGLAPFVRIGEISRRSVLHPLDAGAAGLIIPAVKTVDEVQTLIRYAKFAPLGDRGYLPTRDCRWGTAADFSPTAYMAEANRKTLLFPQCETAECLAQIETIAALEGVDGIFVGPMDLSISLGCPLQLDAPVVRQAIARILAACKVSGKLSMIFAGDAQTARSFLDMGFDSVAAGADIFLLIQAYQQLYQQLNA